MSPSPYPTLPKNPPPQLTQTTAQQPLTPSASLLFVSHASLANGAVESYGLRARVEAVKNCRKVGKHDMKFNGATPEVGVDVETFVSFPPVLLLFLFACASDGGLVPWVWMWCWAGLG